MIAMIEIDSISKRLQQAPLSPPDIAIGVNTRSTRNGISKRRSDALGNSKLCSRCNFLFSNPLSSSSVDASRAGSPESGMTVRPHELAAFHSLEQLAVFAIRGCHLCLQVYLGLDPEALKAFSKQLRSDAMATTVFHSARTPTPNRASGDTSRGFVSIVPHGRHEAKLSFIFVKSDTVVPHAVEFQSGIDLRVDFVLVSAQHAIERDSRPTSADSTSTASIQSFDTAREYVINHNLRPVSISSTSTASDESFDIARKWIAECSENHVKCSTSLDKEWKPTHLLDVGLKDFRNVPGVRLVDGNLVNSNSEYATLSHCWGSSKAVRLHAGTLPALRHGVACTDLPKSLADAALVAQRLGYQYLWVDALCIMHDDERAVLHEMAQMHRIYGSATLNIAATCASGDSEGFLRPRNTDALQPCQVVVRGHEIDNGLYNILRLSTWHDLVDSSPLAKRAWALQERALAKRTLHFTRHELMWECSQHCCSESYSEDLIRQTKPFPPQLLKSNGQCSSESAIIGFNKELYLEQADAWSKLVEYYSTRKMTHRSDRLMAISGLAQQYARKRGLAQTDYVAGMWRSELPHSLLWEARNGRRPSKYRAPTWSWASVDGQILCPAMHSSSAEPCVKVTDVEIKQKYDDAFGFCESAQLTLSGFLARGLLPQKQHHREVSTCSLRFPAAMINFHAVSFDEGQPSQPFVVNAEKMIDTLEVYVLPVLCASDRIQGLFLKATPKSGHFRRVGTFELMLENETNKMKIKQAIEEGLEVTALDEERNYSDLLWFASGNRQTVTLI